MGFDGIFYVFFIVDFILVSICFFFLVCEMCKMLKIEVVVELEFFKVEV